MNGNETQQPLRKHPIQPPSSADEYNLNHGQSNNSLINSQSKTNAAASLLKAAENAKIEAEKAAQLISQFNGSLNKNQARQLNVLNSALSKEVVNLEKNRKILEEKEEAAARALLTMSKPTTLQSAEDVSAGNSQRSIPIARKVEHPFESENKNAAGQAERHRFTSTVASLDHSSLPKTALDHNSGSKRPSASNSAGPSGETNNREASAKKFRSSDASSSQCLFCRIFGYNFLVQSLDREDLKTPVTSMSMRDGRLLTSLKNTRFYSQGPFSTSFYPPVFCHKLGFGLDDEMVGTFYDSYVKEILEILRLAESIDPAGFLTHIYAFCENDTFDGQEEKVLETLDSVIPFEKGYRRLNEFGKQVIVEFPGSIILSVPKRIPLWKSLVSMLGFILMVAHYNNNKIFLFNISPAVMAVGINHQGKLLRNGDLRLTDFSLAVWNLDMFVDRVLYDIIKPAIVSKFENFQYQFFLQFSPEVNFFINIHLYLSKKAWKQNSYQHYSLETIKDDFLKEYLEEYSLFLRDQIKKFGIDIEYNLQISDSLLQSILNRSVESIFLLTKQYNATHYMFPEKEVKQAINSIKDCAESFIDIREQDTYSLFVSLLFIIANSIWEKTRSETDLINVLIKYLSLTFSRSFQKIKTPLTSAFNVLELYNSLKRQLNPAQKAPVIESIIAQYNNNSQRKIERLVKDNTNESLQLAEFIQLNMFLI